MNLSLAILCPFVGATGAIWTPRRIQLMAGEPPIKTPYGVRQAAFRNRQTVLAKKPVVKMTSFSCCPAIRIAKPDQGFLKPKKN